jgi:hypothetical protein
MKSKIVFDLDKDWYRIFNRLRLGKNNQYNTTLLLSVFIRIL